MFKLPNEDFGNVCLPNEDFGQRNRMSGVSVRWTLRGFVAQIEYSNLRSACLFDVLCDGVSTRFGLRTTAKYIEKTRPTSGACHSPLFLNESPFQSFVKNCQPQIQVEFMLPKRRFWKTEQRVGRVFSRYFARV